MKEDMIDKINEIVRGYVEETEVDYVGLWQIIIRVRRELGVVEGAKLKKLVLEIAQDLLDAGLEAVTLREADPVRIRWENQDIAYVLDRISREWDVLGRDPNPGEIVWFDRKRA